MNSIKLDKFLLSLGLVVLLLAACSRDRTRFPTGKFEALGSSGTIHLEFKPDGTFLHYAGAVVVWQGTYTTDGDVYTETSNTAPSSDPRCHASARYNWFYDGTTLEFSLLEDDCPERQQIYTGYAYMK